MNKICEYLQPKMEKPEKDRPSFYWCLVGRAYRKGTYIKLFAEITENGQTVQWMVHEGHESGYGYLKSGTEKTVEAAIAMAEKAMTSAAEAKP